MEEKWIMNLISPFMGNPKKTIDESTSRDIINDSIRSMKIRALLSFFSHQIAFYAGGLKERKLC